MTPSGNNQGTAGRDLALSAGLAGTGAVGYKAQKDLERFLGTFMDWRRSVRMPADPTNEQVVQSFVNYINKGSAVKKSKILGVPVAHYALKAPLKVMDFMDRGNRGKETGLKAAIRHHNNFYKMVPSGDSSGELSQYMLDKLRYQDWFDKFYNSPEFGEDARRIFETSSFTVPQKVQMINKVSPSGQEAGEAVYNALRQMMTVEGYGKIPGRTSYTDAYFSLAAGPGMRLKKLLKSGSKGALALSAVFAALAGTRYMMHSREKKAEDNGGGAADVFKTYGYGTAGTLGLSSGVKDITSPARIGVSWGEMPNIGAGHKEPGKALLSDIRKYIAENNMEGSIEVHPLRRNARGILTAQTKARKLDAAISTGFGYRTQDLDPRVQMNPLLNHPLVKRLTGAHISVPRSGHFAYQTDIGQNIGQPYWSSPDRANLLSWGTEEANPDRNRFLKLKKAKQINVSPDVNMSPAIERAAVDMLREIGEKPKQAIAEDVINYAKRAGMNHTADSLQNAVASGKKLLIISGSGRGDGVSYRALSLLESLKKQGLQDKFQIVALQAGEGSFHPLAKVVDQSDEIISFGKLPKKMFLSAQAMGDLHWGSTGASSAAESLMQQTPTAFITKWAPMYEKLQEIGKEYAAKGEQLPPKYHELFSHKHSLDLDSWNEGVQRALPGKLAGIFSANNADEFLELAKNLPDTEEFRNSVRTRSLLHIQAALEGKEKAVRTLVRRAMRNKRIRSVKGFGKAAIAIAALGAGAKSLKNVLTRLRTENETVSA